jgi:hypothetical protein
MISHKLSGDKNSQEAGPDHSDMGGFRKIYDEKKTDARWNEYAEILTFRQTTQTEGGEAPDADVCPFSWHTYTSPTPRRSLEVPPHYPHPHLGAVPHVTGMQVVAVAPPFIVYATSVESCC